MKFRLIQIFLAITILGSLLGLVRSLAAWETDNATLVALPPRTIPDTDVNPYGANFFLDREVEDWKRDRTVRMAREGGIVWAKQQFSWEEIEKRKNQFDWEKSDQIVAVFEKYGMQIIARLDRPPAWAHKDKSIPQAPPDDFNDYGDFVEAFVRRYTGRINYIQIWNEPNIFPEWGNRPIDPYSYAAMLKIAYLRAKAANPNVRVLSAPLAITLGEGWEANSPYWRNMNDLDFLEELYKAGVKDYFDILSANAFGLRSTPDDPPDPNQLNFQRVVLARQIMERHDDANKAIWINEYGWNASPASFAKDQLPWGRVTEQEQADYTVRGIQQARANWNWIGVFNLWYFRQVGDITPDRSDYYFRMVDVDFTPRLVYLRLKEVATFPQVAQPGVYQETNTAVNLGGPPENPHPWQPLLNPRAYGKSELFTRQPGAKINLKFYGDGFDFIMQRGPTAGRAWVTIDGERVPNLPTDVNGNSYIELASPKEEWQVNVPIAHDLPRRTHTVELVVGQSGDVGFDGFVVYAEGSPTLMWLPITAFGGLLIIAVGLFMMNWFKHRAAKGKT